jgi:hypothetical protein
VHINIHSSSTVLYLPCLSPPAPALKFDRIHTHKRAHTYKYTRTQGHKETHTHKDTRSHTQRNKDTHRCINTLPRHLPNDRVYRFFARLGSHWEGESIDLVGTEPLPGKRVCKERVLLSQKGSFAVACLVCLHQDHFCVDTSVCFAFSGLTPCR